MKNRKTGVSVLLKVLRPSQSGSKDTHMLCSVAFARTPTQALPVLLPE